MRVHFDEDGYDSDTALMKRVMGVFILAYCDCVIVRVNALLHIREGEQNPLSEQADVNDCLKQ
jgi:hypothetical protein